MAEEPATLLGDIPADNPPLDVLPADTPAPVDFDFRSHIPSEYAEEACLKDIQDMPGLVKSYVHAQKAMGSNIVIPGEDATPQDLAAFHQKLGAPEAVDGYSEGLNSLGVDPAAGSMPRIAAKALELGMSKSQLSGIVGEYGAILSEMDNQNAANANVVMETLRGDWGAEYDNKLGLAQQVVQSFGGEDLIAALEASGAGNNPAVIKAFSAIGASLASEGIIDGSAVGAMTKQDAVTQADALMVTEAYLKESDPGHTQAMAEVQRLLSIAYPESTSGDISW